MENNFILNYKIILFVRALSFVSIVIRIYIYIINNFIIFF